jgi:hypothetical protein
MCVKTYNFDEELLKNPFNKNMKNFLCNEDYKEYSRFHTNKKYREKTREISKNQFFYCEYCYRLFHRTYKYKHIKTKFHILNENKIKERKINN